MRLQLFAEQQTASGFKTPGFYFSSVGDPPASSVCCALPPSFLPLSCFCLLLLAFPCCWPLSVPAPFLSFPCIVTSAQLHSSSSVSHPLIKIGLSKLKLGQYAQKRTVSLLSAVPTMVADNIHIQWLQESCKAFHIQKLTLYFLFFCLVGGRGLEVMHYRSLK